MPTWNQLLAGAVLAACALLGLVVSGGVALLVLVAGAGVYLVAALTEVSRRRLREASREVDKILREKISRSSESFRIPASARGRLEQVPERWRDYVQWMATLAWDDRPGSLHDKMRPRLCDHAIHRPTHAYTDCPRGHWGLHHITGHQSSGVFVLRCCERCGLEWAETTKGS